MDLIQRWLHNWPLKLLALLLAVLLSLYIYQVIDPETTERLELELGVSNIRPELALGGETLLPEKVSVVIAGPLRAVQYIVRNAREATLDCRYVSTPGEHEVDVILPVFISSDVEVRYQEPLSLTVSFEERQTKALNLDVRPKGSLNEKYDPGSETVSRQSVEVSGPTSEVSRAASARIEPNINGLTNNTLQTLVIQLYDEDGQLLNLKHVQLNPERVRYELDVVPRDSLRGLRVAALFEGRTPDGYFMDFNSLRVEPSYLTLETELVPEGLEVLFSQPIDLNGKRESFSIDVPINFSGLNLDEMSHIRPDCTVSVVITPIDDQSTLRVAVELLGERDGYSYFPSPMEVLVRSEELQLLDARGRRSIRVELNLGDLQAGSHRVTPQLTLPPSLERVTIDPDTLSVIVQKKD